MIHICDAVLPLLRPAAFFAFFFVGTVYHEGEKTDRLAVEQAGLDGGMQLPAHERRRRHELTHQRGVA